MRRVLYLSVALIAISTAQAAPAIAMDLRTNHYQMPDQDEVWQRTQLQQAPESRMGDWRAEFARRLQFQTPVPGTRVIINSKVRVKIAL